MTRSPRNVERIVEEQVERWRVERARAAGRSARPRPVIAVSRQYGARGAALGHLIAERLELAYWNREIVDEIARHAHVSNQLVRAFDEHHQASVAATLKAMVNVGPLSASDYFRELARVVHTIASHGGAVIIGRGAAFLLDPAQTLRVRVVCELELRVAGIVERSGVTDAQARAELASIDADRRDFVRDHYGRDAEDPAAYDVTVNSGTLSLDRCAEVVACAYRARFG